MEHVCFGTMQVETRDDRHFFVVETIKACDQCKAPNGAVTYSGQVTAVRGSSDYTPRIMPYHPAASCLWKQAKYCGNVEADNLVTLSAAD